MSKAVLNSSVIIALSMLGYLNKLKTLFKEILIAKAVYDEICLARVSCAHQTTKTKSPELKHGLAKTYMDY